jgi:hypothetical protein
MSSGWTWPTQIFNCCTDAGPGINEPESENHESGFAGRVRGFPVDGGWVGMDLLVDYDRIVARVVLPA